MMTEHFHLADHLAARLLAATRAGLRWERPQRVHRMGYLSGRDANVSMFCGWSCRSHPDWKEGRVEIAVCRSELVDPARFVRGNGGLVVDLTLWQDGRGECVGSESVLPAAGPVRELVDLLFCSTPATFDASFSADVRDRADRILDVCLRGFGSSAEKPE